MLHCALQALETPTTNSKGRAESAEHGEVKEDGEDVEDGSEEQGGKGTVLEERKSLQKFCLQVNQRNLSELLRAKVNYYFCSYKKNKNIYNNYWISVKFTENFIIK